MHYFKFPHRRSFSGAHTAILAMLACGSTGCPGDDIPEVTSGDDSSGSSGSTGLDTTTTTTPPDTSATDTEGVDTTEGMGTTESVDTTEGMDTTAGETCGNGMLDEGEDCDGDELGDADCMGQGFVGGTLACADDCTFDTTECVNSVCGNDAIEEKEECDGAELDGQDCMSQGFDDGTLGCGDDCTFDTAACIVFSCGNDMLEGMEVCDGADLAGEDCTTQGFDGGMLACDAGCMAFDTSGCFVCGDDVTNGMEVCDGLDIGAEDCTTQGFDGGTLGCAADCGGYDTSGCYECGDGVANGMEACDGADLAGMDCTDQGFMYGLLACDATCNFDTTLCTDVPTFCSSPATPIGPDLGALTVDTVAVPMAGQFVADVNVYAVGTHSFMGDLEMTIRHVESDISVRLLENLCGTDENFDATFDQDAAAGPLCGGPPAVAGSVLPTQNLDGFLGMPDPMGTWELSILDEVGGDGGQLDSWCVSFETTAMDPSVCGDGVITFTEDCEGADLGGAVCFDIGFAPGGVLGCMPNCQYNTAGCISANEVLLLGDDTTDPAEWNAYRTALMAAGVTWNEVNLDISPFPDAGQLDSFTTVIWFDEGTIIPGNIQAQAIADWLVSDVDHNLFVTGVDYLWDFRDAPIGSGERNLFELFGVQYQGDFAGAGILTLDGVAGDPITNPFVAPGGLVLSGVQSNGDYTDQTMGAPATSAAVYGAGGAGTGFTGLTHFDAGNYQMVWLGVSFHAGLSSAAQRNQLMANIMTYFGV